MEERLFWEDLMTVCWTFDDVLILYMMFHDGMTLAEVGRAYGLSPETVRRKKEKAIKRVRYRTTNTNKTYCLR